MIKSYLNTELSTKKVCYICGKPLKKRIVESKPTAKLCYKCFKKRNK